MSTSKENGKPGRVCNVCKEWHPYDNLVSAKGNNAHSTGYRPLCKPCRKLKQHQYRAENLGFKSPLPVKVPNKWAQEPLPNQSPGQLINKMVGVYVPPPSYVRNDGLKHIPSRGFPC